MQACQTVLDANRQRTVLITGCTRGLGRALLEWCAESPAVKCLVGIGRESAGLTDLRKKYDPLATKVRLFSADMSDAQAIDSIAHALAREGAIPDFVLSNAAVFGKSGPVHEATKRDLEIALETNVLGVHAVMHAFIPYMRQIPGAVLANVSSVAGKQGMQGAGVYCMTKFAVEGLTQSAAEDLKEDALTICSIHPGAIMTDMLEQAGLTHIGTPIAEWIKSFPGFLFAVNKRDHHGKFLLWEKH